ncbi:hypothetical protein CISG_02860 [Coccidioides immitis RMSCC 3703]|uniref:Uncharacterized protein n=1 Tax=Coccidioides immitis RMSCC 3703 TaxID=454286 RepID=A0A0J8R9T4_COCIT|nr:hypothetical protein CISG_02860 [Coccidioides immitis RMSCC 3703]
MPVDMQQAVEIMPLVAQECGESTVFLPSLGPNYRESVIQGQSLAQAQRKRSNPQGGPFAQRRKTLCKPTSPPQLKKRPIGCPCKFARPFELFKHKSRIMDTTITGSGSP